MSSSVDHTETFAPVDDLEGSDDVDLEDVEIRDDVELSATSGECGVPVNAVCTGCSTERTKRAAVEKIDVERESGSFKHVCHGCQKARWYNVLAIRWDLIETNRGEPT